LCLFGFKDKLEKRTKAEAVAEEAVEGVEILIDHSFSYF
jgi:hypothetical protein